MIAVDLNILLYAHDTTSRFHIPALKWWESVMSGAEPVGLCWPVIAGFIRITTNPRVFRSPYSVTEATSTVAVWLGHPTIRILQPTHGTGRCFAT